MHETDFLVALTLIVVFGTGAQWLSWKLQLPSILLLLASGFLAGPVLQLIEPDELFGDMLFPFVSMSVAIILFEGSLSLKMSELRDIGPVLAYILSIGVFITWGLAALAAYFVLQFSAFASILLGAVLVVTGPTVIGPMLRQIRPVGQVGPIARWEGIVIDPIGAVLAVLVYEAHAPLLEESVNQGTWIVVRSLFLTILIGGVFGFVAAKIVAWVLKRHAVPDHLESLVTMLFVLASFTASNVCQAESGLLAVTLMGVVLANSGVSLKHILEFKESLSLLLISGLFILLAARVELSSFSDLGWRGIVFVGIIILIIRPIAIHASTIGSTLNWKERMFLSWLAPRGIVAAAVSSVFAFHMGEEGQNLVPATFLVIVGTVVVYGLTAFPFARRLGLASSNPQGVLVVGANPLARAIGNALQESGITVLLADTNRWNISTARMEGLRTSNVNVLDEESTNSIDLGGIGRLLALTPNDEVNAMCAMHFSELFGRANVFQLSPWRRAEKQEHIAAHLRARILFGEEDSYWRLLERIESGAIIKTTKLTDEFDFEQFQQMYGTDIVPMFVVQNDRLSIVDMSGSEPKPGQKLIALVDASPEESTTKTI